MDTPRRNRQELRIAAEIAIDNAIRQTESLGADVRLTGAVIALTKARDAVSNFVDSEMIKANQ